MKNLTLKKLSRKVKPEILIWCINRFPVPVPSSIKLNTLHRHAVADADWIETGTYLAETTLKLAKKYPKNLIWTIEPSEIFFKFSSKLNRNNISFVFGPSEDKFSYALSKVNEKANFWLDGHYSGDITYKGEVESPILTELELIGEARSRLLEFTIFIDDFRLFGNSTGYPEKDALIEQARILNCNWTVENDIFIMSKR